MKKKIMIVDDSPSVRNKLRNFFSEEGFEVVEAENGQVGLEKSVSHCPDLIFVDVNMPIMNGMSMVREVRKHASLMKTPIFILTTESSQKLISEGRAAGVTAWIVKPFNPELVIKGVYKVLGMNIDRR